MIAEPHVPDVTRQAEESTVEYGVESAQPTGQPLNPFWCSGPFSDCRGSRPAREGEDRRWTSRTSRPRTSMSPPNRLPILTTL
jgi:hypothetical protein